MERDELRRRRAVAQRLHRPPAGSVAELVGELLAVQAQDFRAAPLALRARAAGWTLADVDAAKERGEVVTSWLMRGTLHLVAAADLPWLHALTAGGQHAAGERRLRQLGVADVADRAVDLLAETLAGGAPRTRSELTEWLAGAGIRTEGQAGIHLIALAARRGVLVVGPVRDGEPTYVSRRDWLGDEPDVDRQEAVAELARRYLRAHGPATAADLAGWSGVPLRDVRAGLAAAGDELVELSGGLLTSARQLDDAPPAPTPSRLLPAFDPYLLGWRDRAFAIRSPDESSVAPGGGVVRASAVSDGRVVATWRTSRTGETLRVSVEPFRPLPPDVDAALAADAAEVAHFEGRQPGVANVEAQRG